MTTNPHGLHYIDTETFHEMVHSKAALDDVAVVKFMLNEEVKAAEDSRSATFAISTSKVDRDQDTIEVSGWKLGPYKKNPVVLWAHDYRQPPIAKAKDTGPNQDKLLSTAEFFPPEVSQFADSIYQMVKLGGLRAASVGFRPLKHKFNEDRRGVDILEAELLEWSVVPIPANPGALIQRAPKSCLKFISDWCEQYLDETYGTKGVWVPRFQVEEVFKFMNEQKGKAVTVSAVIDECLGITRNDSPVPIADKAADGTVMQATPPTVEDAVVPDAKGVDIIDDVVLELADEDLLFVDDHLQLTQAIGAVIEKGLTEAITKTVRERLDYARGRIS